MRKAALEEGGVMKKKKKKKNYMRINKFGFCKNDEKKNHKKLMVQEFTPDGVVFMKWNEENEGFDYWCDNKEIKYVYLEVVARKYCTILDALKFI